MKEKCNYYIYLILFIWLNITNKCVLCQSIPPKLLHMDDIGINDTLFTQNIHYCIYKLTEQYEYFYMRYPSVGMDFQKVSMEDIPEIYKYYLTKHASMFTFDVSKGLSFDTIFSYYNGAYFGYYIFDSYWKLPTDTKGNASLRKVSLFYDANENIMFLSDSTICYLQSQIDHVLKENDSKATENNKTVSIENFRYVFFEYDYGKKLHLIESGINDTTCINLSSKYMKKIQHILKIFCKENNCRKIRFSNRVHICDKYNTPQNSDSKLNQN